MLNIALCDDNPLHLEDIKERVNLIIQTKDIEFEIFTFTSAKELLEKVNETWQPEIAILDIEMEGEDGISLAGKLNQIVPKCCIIFLTSYIVHAPEVYNTRHSWFVVKNRADEFLEPAIDKALSSHKEEAIDFTGILVREKGKKTLVPVKDILYIGKTGRKAHIHCLENDYYDTRRPAQLIPAELEKKFLRCHQGYWVNFSMIEELDREELVLKGGIRIPISRTYRDIVRKTFFERYHL